MNYNYSYNAGGGAAAAFLLVVWIVALVFAILAIIGLWKTLTKAGLPGWAAIIPFYNEYNVVKMSNRPVNWFWIMLVCSLFTWIPFIGWLLMIAIFVLWVFIALDVAANFGQGTGFAVLLIIFPSIMFLILGFGSYQYRRVALAGSAGFGATPGGQMMPPPAPPMGQPTPMGQPMPLAPPPPLGQPMPMGQPAPVSPPPAATPTPPPAQAPAPTPPPVAMPAPPPAQAPTPTPPLAEPATSAEPATPAEPVTPAEPATPAPPESPTPPPPPPPPVS